jgi:hypothetical protein
MSAIVRAFRRRPSLTTAAHAAPRVAIVLVCALALLTGPAAASTADRSTELPLSSGNYKTWLAVDPVGKHVFVSAGPDTSSVVVLDFAGRIVKTITGEGGASAMVVDTANHTLYVTLHDANAISEINTKTLTERKRFSITPNYAPDSIAIAGGKLWIDCYRKNRWPGVIEARLDGSHVRRAPAPFEDDLAPVALVSGGPGGKFLAVGDSETEPPLLYVYNVAKATPVLVKRRGYNDEGVADMTFGPSGRTLLLSHGAPYYVQPVARKTLRPTTGKYVTDDGAPTPAVSPDGRFVAAGVGGGTTPNVFVYRAGTARPAQTWDVGAPEYRVLDHDLAFSPNGSKLFVVVPDSAEEHLAFHVLAVRPR